MLRLLFKYMNQRLKTYFFLNFKTKDSGLLRYFLGIEASQSSFGVAFNQHKYTLNILNETGMLDCPPVDNPMDPNIKLLSGQKEPLKDPGGY